MMQRIEAMATSPTDSILLHPGRGEEQKKLLYNVCIVHVEKAIAMKGV